MSKSDLFQALALLPENDPRLARVESALKGETTSIRPASLRLLKMTEAAQETGLSRQTIWRAITDGRLHTVEIRKGTHRIHEDELRRFVTGGGV